MFLRPLLMRTQHATATPFSRIPSSQVRTACGTAKTSSTRRKMSTPKTNNKTIPNSPILIHPSIAALHAWRRPLVEAHRTIGLVPTMGALHAGHISLIRAAARQNHHVVVSIYVNPAQFAQTEDLDTYPSTWDADCEVLRRVDRELADDGGNLGRVSAVFAPRTTEMYPSGFPGQEVHSKGSFVTITPVGEVLEGAARPTFFRGVATVCMKLFNIVQPTRVYLGQKDVQQTVVLRRMVQDFMMPLETVIVPTERDAKDGLALSSRNVYLGVRRRKVVVCLWNALCAAESAYNGGKTLSREEILRPANQLLQQVLSEQKALGPEERSLFEVDYVSLADPDTMQEVDVIDPAKGAVLSGAIKMLPVEKAAPGEDLGHGDGPAVRLLDNIILRPVERDV